MRGAHSFYWYRYGWVARLLTQYTFHVFRYGALSVHLLEHAIYVCVCVCVCVCVQTLLTLDHCIGIIGGRPRHSVYFVGFQGENVSRCTSCLLAAYFHNYTYMYCGQNIAQQLAYVLLALLLVYMFML